MNEKTLNKINAGRLAASLVCLALTIAYIAVEKRIESGKEFRKGLEESIQEGFEEIESQI